MGGHDRAARGVPCRGCHPRARSFPARHPRWMWGLFLKIHDFRL